MVEVKTSHTVDRHSHHIHSIQDIADSERGKFHFKFEDEYCCIWVRFPGLPWDVHCSKFPVFLLQIPAAAVSCAFNTLETAVRPVHDIGALLAFVMGTFYLFVQSWISCQSRSLCDNPCEVYIRLVLSLVSFMAITPMIVCYFLSSQSTFNFHPSDKGYGYHVASAICEWIVAFCFNIFFLTYIREFKNVTMCIKIEMLQASQIDSVSQRMIH
ncbi:DNA damage-regulated autophagy modulator protein 1 isoform X3 [Narcine bancroftii]|uniref:DNA damage-regulated autophagy modulator protein 1 isoform X3 n=1 Tax=Narcine bancroftii TaxID=1343680 RepID=UPI0038312230